MKPIATNISEPSAKIDLVLGSVQFGMAYGITEKAKPSVKEVEKIVSTFMSKGGHVIDTAVAYGDSHIVLGKLPKKPAFMTKIPSLNALTIERIDLKNIAETALVQLKVDQLECISFHEIKDVLGPNGQDNVNQMINLRKMGICRKIGLSLYSPDQLEATIKKFPGIFDIVQAPLSLLDQRFLDTATQVVLLEKMEFHARSIFLQGLLLLAPDTVPNSVKRIKPFLKKVQELCNEHSIEPIKLVFLFLKEALANGKAVVGVHSSKQLKQVYLALEWAHENSIDIDFNSLRCDDLDLIDPRRWKT